MREEKKKDKVRTTIDVDREIWSFVKSDATLKDKTASQIVEEKLEESYKKRFKKAE